jgi:hypothetical protein
MSKPVYSVVLREGCWQIKFEDVYLGEYATAEEAAQAALQIARSRFDPSPHTKIIINANGDITVGDPDDGS